MPGWFRLGAWSACAVLVACTPTGRGRWCDQENEIGLLAQTPSGIPILRARELRGPFEVELEWSATRHAFPANGGVHPPEPVFGGERTVATFSVEPRAGSATYAESTELGECGESVLLVPVSLTVRTKDGRIDSTFEAEADFRGGESHVVGGGPGLAIQSLELPHCDPKGTGAGFVLEAGQIRPFLSVACTADPESESYVPRNYERLMIPRERYTLGKWKSSGDTESL